MNKGTSDEDIDDNVKDQYEKDEQNEKWYNVTDRTNTESQKSNALKN